MVAGSKIPAYFHIVQRGKVPHKRYEEIVKILIWLELGDWESFINEIKASLELEKNDPTRDTETRSTLRDHAANEYKSSAQTQTPMEKIAQEEKTAIPPPNRLMKKPY